MQRMLIACCFMIPAVAPALELTRDEVTAIIKAAPTEEVIDQLRIYPRCEVATFTITTILADGTTTTMTAPASEWYAERKYLVGKGRNPDGQFTFFIRAYDQDTRLYYGWNVYPDGTILHQTGMYDPAQMVMAWTSDEPVAGKRMVLRSIQSFRNKAVNSWKSYTYMDGAFAMEQDGECAYQVFDNRL